MCEWILHYYIIAGDATRVMAAATAEAVLLW